MSRLIQTHERIHSLLLGVYSFTLVVLLVTVGLPFFRYSLFLPIPSSLSMHAFLRPHLYLPLSLPLSLPLLITLSIILALPLSLSLSPSLSPSLSLSSSLPLSLSQFLFEHYLQVTPNQYREKAPSESKHTHIHRESQRERKREIFLKNIIVIIKSGCVSFEVGELLFAYIASLQPTPYISVFIQFIHIISHLVVGVHAC